MSKKKKQKAPVKCDYCGKSARLVNGTKVYPGRPDLSAKQFYYCDHGHDAAYVGCHPGTTNALGRLADCELRMWKRAAHSVFDPIWKSGELSRKEAYSWLAGELGIDGNECHIGMFDADRCKRVYAACKSRQSVEV